MEPRWGPTYVGPDLGSSLFFNSSVQLTRGDWQAHIILFSFPIDLPFHVKFGEMVDE